MSWTVSQPSGSSCAHQRGEPPPPEDPGWEDAVLVSEDREAVIAARFHTYTNPDILYMFHCHFLYYEGLGMMGQFRGVEG